MIKLLVLVAACACTFAALPKQYFSVTCDGTLEVFPGHDMGFAVDMSSMAGHFSEAWHASRRYAVKKACPNANEEQLNVAANVISVEAYLAQFHGGREAVNKSLHDLLADCEAGDYSMFRRGFTSIMVPVSNVPSSCTYADYISGKACAFSWELKEQGIGLHVHMQKCPKLMVPSVVLSCTGAACDNVLRPCSVDADCTGGESNKCTEFFSMQDMADGLQEGLETIKMYNKAKDDPTCKSSKSYGAKVIEAGMKHVMPAFGYSGQSPVFSATSKLGFCNFPSLAKELIDATSKPRCWGIQKEACESVDFCQWDVAFGPTCRIKDGQEHPMTTALNAFQDSFPCTVIDAYQRNMSLDCGGLKDAQPVANQIKSSLAGYVPGTDGGVTLLKFDCHGNLQILDESALVQFRFKGSILIKLLDTVMKTLLDVMPCRADMPTTTLLDLVKSYFSPWSPQFWSGLFLGQDLSNMEATLRTYFATDLGMYRGSTTIVGAPSTCNTATMLRGKCDMELDLTDLLASIGIGAAGTTTKARLQVEPCVESPYGFQMMLSCIGSACDMLRNPIPKGTCDPSSSTSCGEGYSCVDLSMNYFFPDLYKNTACKCKEKPINPSQCNTYNPSQYPQNSCDVEPGACADEVVYLGVTTSTKACSGYLERVPSTMLANFARRVAGFEADEGGGSVCMPGNFAAIDRTKVDKWANETMMFEFVSSTQKNIFTMGSNIKAPANPVPIPAAPISPGGGDGNGGDEMSSASVNGVAIWLLGGAVPLLALALA